MKSHPFDPWGSISLAVFPLAATLMAIYGFIVFGGGLSGVLKLP